MTANAELMPLERMLFAPDRQARAVLKPKVILPAETDMRAGLVLMPKHEVPAEVNDQRELGHVAVDAQSSGAELALLHSLMGHYARQLWDIQKVRLALGNRIAAMDRDGVPEVHQSVLGEQMLTMEKAERALNLHLARLARKHPMRSWIDQAPGIGLPGFARLMGITGSLDRFPNVAKLWAYLGMHVVAGEAPKRRKGEKANWSPQGRVLCHQLGDSIVKLGRGKYREAYDRKKADYEQNRLDWTQARRHNAAMRYAVKELLKDMWLEWRRRVARDDQARDALSLAS